MNIWQDSDEPVISGWRSSRLFIYVVVNLAVFTDAYLYALIIPVLPFALVDVVKIDETDVGWWIGALLAAYGVGLLFGARTTPKSFHTRSLRSIKLTACKQSLDTMQTALAFGNRSISWDLYLLPYPP